MPNNHQLSIDYTICQPYKTQSWGLSSTSSNKHNYASLYHRISAAPSVQTLVFWKKLPNADHQFTSCCSPSHEAAKSAVSAKATKDEQCY